MKKIYIILAICTTLTSCSREEFLDIEPIGRVIPYKTSHFRLMLDYFDDLSGGGVNPAFGYGYNLTQYASDDFKIREQLYNSFGPIAINAYTWRDNIYQQNDEDSDWQTLYGQIYASNAIIERVMDSEGGSESDKRQLLAEAKVHRAYAYFSLTNIYGLHYSSSADSDLAVPLRLGTEIYGVQLPRESVKQLYDFVIEELVSSVSDLPNLPESNPYKFRPTKAGVYGFLSRVYLFMGDYEKALLNANEALQIKNSLLDYNELDINFLTLLRFPGEAQYDPEAIWVKIADPYILRPADNDLYELFNDNDLRKGSYVPASLLYGLPSNDYTYAPSAVSGYLQIGISTPELYLTRAECNARLGNTMIAMEDVNELRKHRIDQESYEDLIAESTHEALAIVKEERRRELAFRGLRFFDLKRYNEFDQANISMSRSLNGESYTLSANSNNWAFPVASKYIEISPEIGENIRD